jgi:hypothetical protein
MPIQAHMALALTAALENDQLSLTGLGWSVRPPHPQPMAVYIVIEIPREEAGVHRWRLELTYADGEPVVALGTPIAGVPEDFVYEDETDVSGLDDPTLKTPLVGGFVAILPPFPLMEGREYVWRLTVDGETRDGWTLAFRTSPPEPPAQTGPRFQHLE